MLQGELDVVLDLINLMEGQQFLGVANIALPSNLHVENQQQALRLQQKVSQLKVHLPSPLSSQPCSPYHSHAITMSSFAMVFLLHKLPRSMLCIPTRDWLLSCALVPGAL